MTRVGHGVCTGLILAGFCALVAMMPTAHALARQRGAAPGPKLEGTADVVFGPSTSSRDEWSRWLAAMKADRTETLKKAHFDPAIYNDPASAWSERSFRQLFLFMYDERFYDSKADRYRTGEWLGRWQALYGPVDAVLLWHAYPRIGFDSRDQFAFYREMPGGLKRLRRDVTDVLHARGVKVYVDYNPWDVSGDLENAAHRRQYAEMAAIVGELDADGVMLDTLTAAPASLTKAMERVKKGVVFTPETHPPVADMSASRQSWAQWYDLGDRAAIYRQKWLEPRYQLYSIRRWDLDRRDDIVFSFFNGSGVLIWDNVFGAWNPYSGEDRRLLAETGSVLTSYRELIATGQWEPLEPTGVEGLDQTVWRDRLGRVLRVYRNRTDRDLTVTAPDAVPPGMTAVTFWPRARVNARSREVTVPARGAGAFAVDLRPHAELAADAFDGAQRSVHVPAAGYDDRTPVPHKLLPEAEGAIGGPRDEGLIALAGGRFTMTITHQRRECGCYPFGADENAMWGDRFTDILTHRIDSTVKPFSIKRTAVTNNEYLSFVRGSGYRPRDAARFLAQIPRGADGALPERVGSPLGDLPVTYVSLDDARAYARWRGERLPTEAEWQWAAEGAGQGNRWPWGSDDAGARDGARVNLTGRLEAADAHPNGATPQGVLGLSGNAWELTESEYSDGHTRFAMVRGGVYLGPAESEWIIERGPRPNGYHAKYLLLSDGLDRSETVSFRTVLAE